ncbi:hypothetical protein AB1Y20_018853 [Prymnesium parvum]|uniref:Uncharacterized protein n=1 Tax=Prymnesium parvum TaxID=97485 RepID=A0AB34JT00_PRYPA
MAQGWLRYLGTLFEYVREEGGEAEEAEEVEADASNDGTQLERTSFLLEAEVARQRWKRSGIIQTAPPFPPKPIFTNNAELEAVRTAEYEALRLRCAAELEVWNAEARRWAIERPALIEACVRAEAARRRGERGVEGAACDAAESRGRASDAPGQSAAGDSVEGGGSSPAGEGGDGRDPPPLPSDVTGASELRDGAPHEAPTAEDGDGGGDDADGAAEAAAEGVEPDLSDVRRVAELHQTREERTAARDELIEAQRQRFVEVWTRKLKASIAREQAAAVDGMSRGRKPSLEEEEEEALMIEDWAADLQPPEKLQSLEGWGSLISASEPRPAPWSRPEPLSSRTVFVSPMLKSDVPHESPPRLACGHESQHRSDASAAPHAQLAPNLSMPASSATCIPSVAIWPRVAQLDSDERTPSLGGSGPQVHRVQASISSSSEGPQPCFGGLDATFGSSMSRVEQLLPASNRAVKESLAAEGLFMDYRANAYTSHSGA